MSDNNKNSKNLDYCSYCNSCNSCYSCNSCNSCYSCYSCNSCYSCYSCSYCYSCYSCSYCYYCYYCYSCYSCYSCSYCNSCNSCYSCSSCYYSKNLRMSEHMIFCLGEDDRNQGIGYQQNYMVFNQKVDKDEWRKINNSLPTIKLPLETWIDKDDMTKEEKKNVSGWSEMGGYLKHMGYEEAWANWWSEAEESDKQAILNCKYFDSKIFIGITGLKDFATKSLSGKTVKVEIDGESYTAIIQ